MPPLRFDPDATVEEIAGIGRHAAFDTVIDDKDDDSIQVICKRADGTEIPLANPARAFYFGDRVLYNEEAKRYDLGEKQRVLNTDQFPRNERRFDELKRACKRGFVIPFVGAGMSKSAGCPEWKEYLLNLCPEAGFDQDTMRQRLEEHGDYEGVMHDLVTRLGGARFNLDFERDFKPEDDFAGAIMRLPDLFDNAAITTNFDRVLEMAYERSAKAFVEKTTGRGPVNAFYRALPAGERYLLKLHGNLDNTAERVLIKTEYDDAGAIGRRYRRQDEIGTPYCITVDYDTKDDTTVTLRDRDSMEQIRGPSADVLKALPNLLKGKLAFDKSSL